jgi:hypothetical protein
MRLFRVIGALLFSATAAMAYDRVSVEGWEITYFPESGTPTGCIMGADFQDGTRVSIVLTAQYEWALGLGNNRWNLTKDAVTDVAAYVDGQFIASGKAIRVNGSIALLPLTGSAPFRALQKGQGLDLQTPYGNLKFALQGTGKAMYALLDCVKSLQPRQPTPGPSATNDFQMVPQAEAVVILTNLLNAAGIRSYRLEPPKPDSPSVHFTLGDGTGGTFVAARGLGTKNADDYAAHAIGKRSKICSGQFMSGKESIPSVDGSVVRKVVTTCRTGDRHFATETTIIRQPNGFLMDLSQFMLASSGASLSDGGTNHDHQALINAALRIRDLR